MASVNKHDHVHWWGLDGILSESVLYLVMKVVNYSSMLIAMSFNFWLILALCGGSAISCFIFEVLVDRESIGLSSRKHSSFRKATVDDDFLD